MRKRQRRKLAAQEAAREERQRAEAEEELRKRTVYSVVFDGPTLRELETVHSYHKTEFIPGTAQARCITLKKDGHFTKEGLRVYQELTEAEKNDRT